MSLPWNERLNQFEIHPHAASPEHIQRMATELNALRDFARRIMENWPNDVGIEGDVLQEIAAKFGLIAPTDVTEPCGEVCFCAQYVGDFPTTCYRATPLLTGKVVL